MSKPRRSAIDRMVDEQLKDTFSAGHRYGRSLRTRQTEMPTDEEWAAAAPDLYAAPGGRIRDSWINGCKQGFEN